MTVLVDPKRPHAFTPGGYLLRPEGERVTYLLRVPTPADRPRFRHALVAEGARTHTEFELLAGLEAGIREVFAGDELAALRERALGLVEAQRAKMLAWLEARETGEISRFNDPDEFLRAYFAAFTPAPELVDVQRDVADGSARFARLLADRAVFRELRGLLAAQMFLVGWEGLPDPVNGGPAVFTRGAAGVPLHALACIPSADVESIGDEIDRLLEPGDAQRGNSRSPSSTPNAAASSTAPKTRPAKARSKTTGGTSRKRRSAI